MEKGAFGRLFLSGMFAAAAHQPTSGMMRM